MVIDCDRTIERSNMCAVFAVNVNEWSEVVDEQGPAEEGDN